MERTYESGGINWIHYLDVRLHLDDGAVEILASYRCHKYEDSFHPKTDGDYVLVESSDGKRIVTGVYLTDTTNRNKKVYFRVRNPRYIFDYPHAH